MVYVWGSRVSPLSSRMAERVMEMVALDSWEGMIWADSEVDFEGGMRPRRRAKKYLFLWGVSFWGEGRTARKLNKRDQGRA